MKIRDMQRVPPHPGYDYVQPETGLVMAASSFWLLLRKIKEHRKANGLPIPQEFEKEIMNDWCQRNLHACVMEEGDEPLTFPKMLKGFAKEIAKWTLAGFPRVNDAILKERLEICDKCTEVKRMRAFGVMFCGKCGCAVGGGGKRTVKLHLATAQCPINKWGPVTK